ncbi:endonuclease VII [Mycobacterium phage EagleEye]|uniref:EndoVII n=1 Tax=Mycobacterium phage EagleEye TaxID=1429759 RepID=W0LNX5_9CAUD|nr:endonuclease VII [Mycobacterium phage EagleEye]AHG23845.1 EndoVII [Mycobacterium phage EagleEye]QNJ55881.1 endonuclease VII [Mycobacterium phage PainterBoy]
MPRPKKTRQCVDCLSEGITSKRKAPHPGPRCATHHRGKKRERSSGAWGARILATYGISPEEYWQIYEFQGGRCYICQRANGKFKRLSVDHDHKTGIVRGLLCTMCNKYTLGWARDCIEFFERAIDYLRKPPAVQVIGERIAPIEADKIRSQP